MNVHQGIEHLPTFSKAIVTSGSFDGVHLGHQKILSYLTHLAHIQKAETVIVTFWPHPRIVLAQPIALLNTIEEKTELLSQAGIDHLVIIPFTHKFSQMSAEQYVQTVYIDAIKADRLVLGYDHHFGKDRSGNFEYLQQHIDRYPFEIEEISRQDIEDNVISSSKIRKALSEGDIHLANTLLGRPYSFSGKVVQGQQIGRSIGFPTANIQLDVPYKVTPSAGVYAVKVRLHTEEYSGMMHIGGRPTLDDTQSTIEVHLFDFQQDLYGQSIDIEVIQHIRNIEKFDDLEGLKTQLEQDKVISKKILEEK